MRFRGTFSKGGFRWVGSSSRLLGSGLYFEHNEGVKRAMSKGCVDTQRNCTRIVVDFVEVKLCFDITL
jgi:hypothetical protein